jgi:two-component system, LuxR family, response regulator FixJ
MSTDRVHIVDDDPAVRDSLRVLLESAGFAVTTHESAAGFLPAAAELSGCVLTDIRMP